ncbi:MAG: hypothetical protein R3F13_01785 [Prosthecobacter sp.]
MPLSTSAVLRHLAFFALGCGTVAAQGVAVVTTRGDEVGKKLNEWFLDGDAAGLSAITYENRDGQHSPLNTALYPQLQVFHGKEKNTGAATELRKQPTIGNCSMASAATQLGCLPRLYMMDPGGNRFLALQYLNNNLFVYPEHQDHDPGANGIGGYGDLLPLNTPCLLISQGSSFTDQPFVQALLSTTAAFPKDTQKLLIEKRMLCPTLQSIFRQSNSLVQNPEDYFTGKAHPVVFDGTVINEEKMVQIAHEMTPEKIPPVALIKIIEETMIEPVKNYFEIPGVYSWKISDTPVSVGRILRGNEAEHGMLLSLEQTINPGTKPMQLRASILQGDPRFVRVESAPGKAVMRVRVRWQPPIINASRIRSHRIDIGIFADNGESISAPAIISFYMLPNEMHFYDEQGRVSEIHYQTHNPDFGLPVTDTDPRWLRVFLAFSMKDTDLRSRLLDQVLTPTERTGLQNLYVGLKPKLDALNAAERDDRRKDEATKLRGELGGAISAALNAKVDDKTGLTSRQAVEKVLQAIANSPTLYIGLQQEFDELVTASPKNSALGDVRAELHRLIMQGILIEHASGRIETMSPPDKLSLGERHMLRGLNMTLLSQILFPDALERSTAPAYVSPRLTTPKQWRDVYRYDPDSGKLLGWIRYAKSRIANFDAEGRYQPDGPGGKSVPVIYLKDDNETLTWQPRPAEGPAK